MNKCLANKDGISLRLLGRYRFHGDLRFNYPINIYAVKKKTLYEIYPDAGIKEEKRVPETFKISKLCNS